MKVEGSDVIFSGKRRRKIFIAALVVCLVVSHCWLFSAGLPPFLGVSIEAHGSGVIQIVPQEAAPTCANISVIVPLTPDRLHLTTRFLESFENGTRLPCEFVFSLSSSSDQPVSLAIPARLRSNTSVIVVTTPERKNAAQNRNIAAGRATMPVLVNLDSDDVATPIWIESVEKVFASHGADAMVHLFFKCRHGIHKNLTLPLESDLVSVNELFPAMNWSERQTYRWTCCNFTAHPKWHNAHIAVKRDVYLAVKQREEKQFERMEDSYFTADLLLQGYRMLHVNKPLTGYC